MTSLPCRAAAALATAILWLPGIAAAGSHCGASYAVRPGDTLASIARSCGTTVEALAAANARVTDPARISIGWELTIPGAPASLGRDDEVRPAALSKEAEAALAEGTYEVRPGDSFAGIATALKVPMRGLMAANEGVDPFALRPGQTLRLPEPPEAGEDADQDAGTDPGPDGSASARESERRGSEAAAERRGAAPTEAATAPADQGGSPVRAERVVLEGRVHEGADCALLATPEGEVYSLVSTEYGLLPGEYVEIEGELVEHALCSEGRATLRATSLSAVRPEGG
jgi:LysM repeat protein